MVKKKSTNKKVSVQKVIKTISLTREQILTFLEFEEKEAGEFIIAIARYVSDGKYPTFKDRFKNLFFKNTFGNSLERQLQNYDTKTAICQTNAEKRKGTPDDEGTNEGDAVRNEGNDDTNDVSTTSSQSVNDTEEDLSYSAFIALYGKSDKYDQGGQNIWNGASHDEKRKILAFVKEHIVPSVDVTKREFPSSFLKSKVWN